MVNYVYHINFYPLMYYFGCNQFMTIILMMWVIRIIGKNCRGNCPFFLSLYLLSTFLLTILDHFLVLSKPVILSIETYRWFVVTLSTAEILLIKFVVFIFHNLVMGCFVRSKNYNYTFLVHNVIRHSCVHGKRH